jgi:outer membrane protein TolC
MKKHFSIALLILLCCTPSLFPQDNSASKPVPLTFEKALEQMITSNESLKAAKSEEEQRKLEKYAATGLYFPQVGAAANMTKLSEPVVMDLNDIRTAIQAVANYGTPYEKAAASQLPDFKKTIVEDKFAKVDATLKGPIFTGGKITAANKAASARIDESASRISDTIDRLITELSSRYFGLRLAIKVVDVRQMVLDGMKKHLDDSRALQTNGMIANVERLHAEVAYADAERELKKSERDRDLASTALNNTLSGSIPVDPATPMFIFTEIEPLDFFKRSALENNPLLKQIRANRDLAHAAYLKELSTFSPNIYYFGSYQMYGWHTPSSEILPKWMVGVGATATLFEGFTGYNSVRAARAQEEKVAALESKARKDILTLVEKNYQELMKALEQYHSIEASSRFAEEYLRVRDKAYSEGIGTSTEVVDARLALAKVKIDRLKAVYDFDVALASLFETGGISDHYIGFLHRKDVEVEF